MRQFDGIEILSPVVERPSGSGDALRVLVSNPETIPMSILESKKRFFRFFNVLLDLRATVAIGVQLFRK